MARIREIVVKPPTGGVVESYAYQHQPPYTCVDASNVWMRDIKTGRRRIGPRPYLSAVGSISGVVRNISEVNLATNQQYARGLFCIANGSLYRYASSAWGSEGGSFSTDRYISAAAYLQELFIADGTNWSVYDCAGDSLESNPSATAGTKPTEVTLVCAWNDRIVWSGNADTPQGFWMSRQGDPYDYDYSQTDVQRAIDDSNTEGGNIGERITALIPHNRNCIIFGATDSIFIIRGDPAQGGRLEMISSTVGPIDAKSWCKTGDDHTAILTRNGLYIMPPGCDTNPQPYSVRKLPNDLLGIDTGTYNCFLEYDTRFNGIWIFVTETSGASSGRQAWFLDWEDGGFLPISFTTGAQPQSILRFDPLDASGASGVLMGGSDEINRPTVAYGGETSVTGQLKTAPIKLSKTPLHKGIIQRMRVVFSENTLLDSVSAALTVKIATGETAEAAVSALDDTAMVYSATYDEWLNNPIHHPRLSGHAAAIQIDSTMAGSDDHFGVEEIILSVRDQGMQR